MRGFQTAGALLGLAAMLGGGAFAATTATKHAAPKTAVKTTAKTAKTMAKPAHKTAAKMHKTASHAKSGKYISAATAEKIARAKYHGKVVGRPVLQRENGKHDYAVKLMNGNTEREVKVDANTGKIDSARLMTAGERTHKARKPATKAHTAAARKPMTKPSASAMHKTSGHKATTKAAAKKS